MIIFWLSATVLGIVLIAYCILLARSSRKTSIPIAYAGTLHGDKPAELVMDRAVITRLEKEIAPTDKKGITYSPYVVDGDSMQFAKIKSGDIVFVENWNSEDHSFPQVVVLQHVDQVSNRLSYKVRRAWSTLPKDVNEEKLMSISAEILASSKFENLRSLVGDKCPSDQDLKMELLSKFRNLPIEKRSNQLLLSTTYNTAEKRIALSLHNLSAIVGVVRYVSAMRS